MKNIWYISKYAISITDGNPSRQYFLSKYMVKEGLNVTLFSSQSAGIKKTKIKGIGRKQEIDNFTHILLNGPEINLGFSLKRILSWLIFELLLLIYGLFKKTNKPDVIIVSSLSLLTIITGYFFKIFYRSKLIFEVRDIWPLTLMEIKNLSKSNPFIFLLRSIEKFGYKKADHIVGTMPKLNQHIKNSIRNNFKFTNIPMGFDKDFYSELKSLPQDLKKLIPSNKFIVGYAGAIGLANCVNEIVDAAKIISDINPNIYFVILGDGALKNGLINKSKQLNNIVFLPKVDKIFVNDFLTSCDVLVNPWQDKTIYKYGVSPNKWIDYMYSSRPIIVSYNGYQSIINEANCGEFIEANNPNLLAEKIIEYSHKNKEELVNIGNNGQEYLLNNLSYSVLAKKYKAIIQSLYV